MVRQKTGYAVYLRNYLLLTAVLWTLAVFALLALNIASERKQSIEQATMTARAYFEKDVAYRLWATKHGGVYVPATEVTPPNPYLSHVKERDIVTPSGKRLTLMNPAYMLRQVMSDFEEIYGVKGHITSLRLLNPANVPDDWERFALEHFQTGKEEITEVTELDGAPYLRFIKPMVTTEGCLKCHAIQGYRVGEIRGGISLAVPLKEFWRREQDDIRLHVLSHALFLFAGLAALFMFWRQGMRYLAEKTKAELERERLYTGIDQSPDAVMMTDPEGTIQYVNPAFEKLTGYSLDEVIGQNPRLFKSGVHGPEFYAALWHTVKSGKTWKGVITNKGKNGGLYQIETSISPTFDEAGHIANFVAVKHDISRESQLQKARDYFTAVTSHELRTPLSKLKLLTLLAAELEKEKKPGEPAARMRELLDAVYRDLERMLQQTTLISDINLTWQKRLFAPFYLYVTLDQCVKKAAAEIARNGRTVSVHASLERFAKEAMVAGNEGMIASAVDNILSNAVKYTPDGKNIYLDAAIENGMARITIRDEGKGMSKEAIAHAFDPYFSLEGADHHASGSYRYLGGGLGLGLTLARMIVEYHDGELRIEGHGEGNGISVTITFPASREPAADG